MFWLLCCINYQSFNSSCLCVCKDGAHKLYAACREFDFKGKLQPRGSPSAFESPVLVEIGLLLVQKLFFTEDGLGSWSLALFTVIIAMCTPLKLRCFVADEYLWCIAPWYLWICGICVRRELNPVVPSKPDYGYLQWHSLQCWKCKQQKISGHCNVENAKNRKSVKNWSLSFEVQIWKFTIYIF